MYKNHNEFTKLAIHKFNLKKKKKKLTQNKMRNNMRQIDAPTKEMKHITQNNINKPIFLKNLSITRNFSHYHTNL